MSKSKNDRLYELLPAIYRSRDAEGGYPLKALLQVISEQVEVVEDDIRQLYDNLFIETCLDWVVPYIGDLIGYRPVSEAGVPGDVTNLRGLNLNKILIPRQEVANTISYRRRKGTLALLEILARDISGWPARAVEFYQLLAVAEHLNHQHPDRGRLVGLRWGNVLDRLAGPFDESAHTVDVRRINSSRTAGSHNIPNVGLFLWRIKSYSVTRSPAYCLDSSRNLFTFSMLGNDSPLFTRAVDEPEATHIAQEINLPVPIRRRAFDDRTEDYYGLGKSLCLWREDMKTPVPLEDIIPADLSSWMYRPQGDKIAVDPVLGRIALSKTYSLNKPDAAIWVSYHYGFSADIGGGEYDRQIPVTHEVQVYRVGREKEEEFQSVGDAISRWDVDKLQDEGKRNAIIEITDSNDYVEPIKILLKRGDNLVLRAANGKRPVIRLLNRTTNKPDYMKISGSTQGNEQDRLGRLTLDGLLITGSGLQITGELERVNILHCTLVPGWSLDALYLVETGTVPSLDLIDTTARIVLEHSISGSIQVNQDYVKYDPTPISISDSILDSTYREKDALGSPDCTVAHALLTIKRSTVIGKIHVHALELAEDSIFLSPLRVARRQIGCMRFCFVTPESRTPRRFNCQPDLVVKAVEGEMLEQKELSDWQEPSPQLVDAAKMRESIRVRPQFNTLTYGVPEYCQLTQSCAREIKCGAEDESEMGVFHDLYQPQRETNLRARLEEYTPASTDASIIFVN